MDRQVQSILQRLGSELPDSDPEELWYDFKGNHLRAKHSMLIQNLEQQLSEDLFRDMVLWCNTNLGRGKYCHYPAHLVNFGVDPDALPKFSPV